jgi:hypothetical protein
MTRKENFVIETFVKSTTYSKVLMKKRVFNNLSGFHEIKIYFEDTKILFKNDLFYFITLDTFCETNS